MFVSQAHSFRQQARLAITLAWVAGYTNIVTFLACGTVISHVSGTTSQLGRDFFTGDFHPALFALFLLASFFLGAAVSGFCTELGRRRNWESIYVLPIIIETLLLASFAAALEFFRIPLHPPAIFLMTGLASAAMGLQNATITRISNGTVRTTHVTGVLTDLGHDTVGFLWWLRDRRKNLPAKPDSLPFTLLTHPAARRLALLASILITFAFGAGLAALAYSRFSHATMIPPACFLLWLIYQDLTRPIAEIEPSALISGDPLNLPASLAVFHLRKDHDRRGRIHRMPNLLAWSDRLPPSKRIVILDLAEASDLDANATLELHAVLAKFSAEHRHLILAGITLPVLARMRQSLPEEMLPNNNICPDLELAIARGLNLM